MVRYFILVLALIASVNVYALDIPFDIVNSQSVERSEIVVSGVPITDGDTLTTSAYGVFDGVTELDADFTVLGRYQGTPYDGTKYIKWVLVSFPCTVSASSTKSYTLKTTGGSGPVATGITVTDNAGSYVVDTGAATFTINKTNFNILDNVLISGTNIITTSTNNGAVFNTGSKTFYSGLSTPSLIEIERAGKMSTVIHAEGVHKASDTTESVDYIVRITFYYNKSYCKIDYTFRNTESTTFQDSVSFSDISIVFDTVLSNPNYNFSDASKSGTYTAGQTGYIYQYGLRNAGNPTTTGASSTIDYLYGGDLSGAGDHADGFMSIDNGSVGVSSYIRNFWKLYPKAQYSDADGTIQAKLWPSYDNLTDATVAEKLYAGVQKTHTILFDFKTSDFSTHTNNYVINDPLNINCGEVYYCSMTNNYTLGLMAERGASGASSSRNATISNFEAKMDADLALMLSYREEDTDHGEGHEYGMWHFGDGRQSHWVNSTYDPAYSVLREFLRGGAKDYLSTSIEMIEHSRDVDILHPGANAWFGTTNVDKIFGLGTARYLPQENGAGDLLYMHDMGVAPRAIGWNLEKGKSLALHYFLTGDELSKDILEEITQRIYDYWLNYDNDNIFYESRAFGKCLPQLLAIYDIDGDSAKWLNNGVYDYGPSTGNTSAYTIVRKGKDWCEFVPGVGPYSSHPLASTVNCDGNMRYQSNSSNSYGTGLFMSAVYWYGILSGDDTYNVLLPNSTTDLNDDEAVYWKWDVDHWGTNEEASAGLISPAIIYSDIIQTDSTSVDRAFTALDNAVTNAYGNRSWKIIGEAEYQWQELSFVAADRIISDLPTVTLQSDYSTTSATTSFQGTAEAQTGTIASVVSDNGTVTIDSGAGTANVSFTVSNVNLSLGLNTVTVTATDSEANTGNNSIGITRTAVVSTISTNRSLSAGCMIR